MHVEPSRVTHSNTIFWVKRETFCKLILHTLPTARQCQFPDSFAILNLINVNTVNFSLSHSSSPMLSNVHKYYENNSMYALEVSEIYILYFKSVTSVF